MTHQVHTVFLPGTVPNDPAALTTAIEEVMEHYSEQREVEPYRDEYESFAVTRSKLVKFAARYPEGSLEAKHYATVLAVPDVAMAEDYHGTSIELDPENPGMYWSMSTWNPDGHWDWFQIGGRWAGRMQLKPDAPDEGFPRLDFSWGWDQKDIDEVTAKGRPTDAARIEHVAPESIKPPVSYLDLEGKWFDDPDSWSREDGPTEWKREYMQFVTTLPKDTWIINLDIHS